MPYKGIVEYHPSSLDARLLAVMNEYARRTVSRVCETEILSVPSILYVRTDDPKDKKTVGLYWGSKHLIGISKKLFDEAIRPLGKKRKETLVDLIEEDPPARRVYRFGDAVDAFAILCHEYAHHVFTTEHRYSLVMLLHGKKVPDCFTHLGVIDEAVAVHVQELSTGLPRMDDEYWSNRKEQKNDQFLLEKYYTSFSRAPPHLTFVQKVRWTARHGRERRMETPKVRTSEERIREENKKKEAEKRKR